jgi:head-tail adaptor
MASCDCGIPIANQKRFTLQRPAGTADATGHVDLSVNANWTNVSTTLWGAFTTKGGSEIQTQNQAQGVVHHTIEFPYSSTADSIIPKWRLKLGSRLLNITSAVNVNEGDEVIRVEATEKK